MGNMAGHMRKLGDVAGDMAKLRSNLKVKLVRIVGNARFDPFYNKCVLHLRSKILVYVG